MNPAGGGGIGAPGKREGGGGGHGGGGGATGAGAGGAAVGGLGAVELTGEVVESAGVTWSRSDNPETENKGTNELHSYRSV